MDPLGFALENFDAVGAWRVRDGRAAIDASGVFVDGSAIDGPVALRAGAAGAARELRRQPDREAADLRPRPRHRSPRHAGRARHRARCRAAAATGSRRSCSASSGATPFQKRIVAANTRTRLRRLPCSSQGCRYRGARSCKGMGATIALPFLDAMVPAFSPRLKAATGPRRAAFIYFSNGTVIEHWTPATTGKGVGLSDHPQAARAASLVGGGADRPRQQGRRHRIPRRRPAG